MNPFDTIMLMFATLLRVTSGFAIPCSILVASLSFDEFIYYQIAKNEEYFCNQSIKKLENYITTSTPDNFLENEVTRWMYYIYVWYSYNIRVFVNSFAYFVELQYFENNRLFSGQLPLINFIKGCYMV